MSSGLEIVAKRSIAEVRGAVDTLIEAGLLLRRALSGHGIDQSRSGRDPPADSPAAGDVELGAGRKHQLVPAEAQRVATLDHHDVRVALERVLCRLRVTSRA